MTYLPTVHCPRCGTEFSAMASKCPNCGNKRTLATDKEFTKKQEEPAPPPVLEKPVRTPRAPAPAWQTALGSGLIVLGLLSLCLCFALLHYQNLPDSEPALPEPTETPAPTPPPTPTIESLSLHYLDRDLAEGFTAYVGDAPLTLQVSSVPAVKNARFTWRLSDPASAILDVSADTLSCDFTALKPSGKNTLTVSCYGVEYSVPVYLWNK